MTFTPKRWPSRLASLCRAARSSDQGAALYTFASPSKTRLHLRGPSASFAGRRLSHDRDRASFRLPAPDPSGLLSWGFQRSPLRRHQHRVSTPESCPVPKNRFRRTEPLPSARGRHTSRLFRPCRSSRLRRFAPRCALQVCCTLQPAMGFAGFPAASTDRADTAHRCAPPGWTALAAFLTGATPFGAFPSPAAAARHRAAMPSRRHDRSSRTHRTRKRALRVPPTRRRPQGFEPPSSPLRPCGVATALSPVAPMGLSPLCIVRSCTFVRLRRTARARASRCRATSTEAPEAASLTADTEGSSGLVRTRRGASEEAPREPRSRRAEHRSRRSAQDADSRLRPRAGRSLHAILVARPASSDASTSRRRVP